LQKRKIIAVVLLVAVIAAAIVGYEFFIVNSLSGYTKVSLAPVETYSVKFGNTAPYNITFLLLLPNPNVSGGVSVAQDTTLQVIVDNAIKYFDTIQGARYSFSGLQMVVGSANFKQVNSNREVYLTLYVKSTVSNSEPIISSMPYSGVPLALVSLSPSDQTAVISLHQSPSFSLTLSQAGNYVNFPCSVTLYYSFADMLGQTSIPQSWTIKNYGTYDIPQPYVGEVPTIQRGASTSFWVVVQDSNGNKVTSNTVTVEYK
jgi:hypothetical protein